MEHPRAFAIFLATFILGVRLPFMTREIWDIDTPDERAISPYDKALVVTDMSAILLL